MGDRLIHEEEKQVLAARKFAVLGKPIRLQIYKFLVKAGHSGASVGDIQQHLLHHGISMAASTLSHHVAQLVWAGLIQQTRQGTTLLCQVEFDEMTSLINFLQSECCAAETPNETNTNKPSKDAAHV